jgi:hypothetical protein
MFVRILAFTALLFSAAAFAIGTAFTYQGTLEEGGALANGSYDLQFRVLNSGGGQVGNVIVQENVAVIAGVFTAQLDFGSGAFSGADRFLEIGVRPGAATGAFVVLTPTTPLHAAPYAQRATDANSAAQAADVVNGSIDEVDIATGAVSSRTIGNGAIVSDDLAGSAVTGDKIAGNAITSDKVANNSLTLSDIAGANGNYNVSFTIAANDCHDFDVSFGGDVQQNDVPIIVMPAGEQLPDSMSITALRVISDNLIEVRICNEIGVTQSYDGQIRMITIR